MNITKSYLQKIINEEIENVLPLLQEGAKGPGDLPDNIVVVISVFPGGATPGARIFYAEQFDKVSKHTLDAELSKPWGKIEIVSMEGRAGILGPCGDAWKIHNASADDGWGPLLYDVAMEWATLNGGGLMADRGEYGEVSGEARDVWDYYLNKRSDVASHQLDNLENELTPDIEEDNCDQDSARWNDWAIDPQDMDTKSKWAESSLSKRYTKEPVTMQELESLGKLIEQERSR